VVGAPLVAVANAPAGVQQLVGQVQDLVLQHVAVQNVVPEIPMEEDDDAVLQRLFFKKFGRALPEPEKEKDVDINFIIDLTDEKDEDEMEVATSENVPPVPVVKTEPIEISSDLNESAASKVAADRKERRELVKGRKALIAFGKSLRKTDKIPEKETPEVVADSNVSEDTSVTTVNVKSLTTDEAIEMAEAAIAESDATIVATPLDEFDDESEFRLFPDEDDVIEDDDDAMIDDV
jgi:hypothetical protein